MLRFPIFDFATSANANAAAAAANAAVDAAAQPWAAEAAVAFRARVLAADNGARRALLGERLYPRVARLSGAALAGKVTGMLLELEAATLLALLWDARELRDKVDEALAVLAAAGRLPPGFAPPPRAAR